MFDFGNSSEASAEYGGKLQASVQSSLIDLCRQGDDYVRNERH